jgi:hypothetical protein
VRAACVNAIRSVVARTHLCRTELDFRRLVNGSYEAGCDEEAPVRRAALRAWLRRDASDDGAARAAPPRFDGAIAWIFCGGHPASLARWRTWLADAEAQRVSALAAANARHGAHQHLHGAAAVGGHSAMEHALSRIGALRADEGLPWTVAAATARTAPSRRGRRRTRGAEAEARVARAARWSRSRSTQRRCASARRRLGPPRHGLRTRPVARRQLYDVRRHRVRHFRTLCTHRRRRLGADAASAAHSFSAASHAAVQKRDSASALGCSL